MKRALPLLLVASTAHAATGWRPGLAMTVHGSISMHKSVTGQKNQDARADVWYRVTTEEKKGLIVRISDAQFTVVEGGPELQAELLRDMLFFRTDLAFRVSRVGTTVQPLEPEQTLARVRALAPGRKLYVSSFSMWLQQLWDSWHAELIVDAKPRPGQVPDRDGGFSPAQIAEKSFSLPCPDGKGVCTEYVRQITLDGGPLRERAREQLKKDAPDQVLLDCEEKSEQRLTLDAERLPRHVDRSTVRTTQIDTGPTRQELTVTTRTVLDFDR